MSTMIDVNDFKNHFKHDALIADIKDNFSEKSAKYPWKSNRQLIGTAIDDFGIIGTRKKISIDELLTSDKKYCGTSESFHRNFKLEKFIKKKILNLSLHKHLADKILRKINHDDLCDTISKYDKTVKEMRNADQLIFPSENDSSLQMLNERPENRSDSDNNIAFEINEALSQNDATEAQTLTDDEMQFLCRLNFEEARKLHKELQRSRVLISYQEAKFRRLRQIKSKKYHRIKRKKLLKNDAKNIDEKWDEYDRLRALERASLRHMNTGKWAKQQSNRGKYDNQVRNDLNEQLKISQELMKKKTGILDCHEKNNSSHSYFEFDHHKKENDRELSSNLLSEKSYDYCPWSSQVSKKSFQPTCDDKAVNFDENDVKHMFHTISENLEQNNELSNLFGDDNGIIEQFSLEQKQNEAIGDIEMNKTKFLPGWSNNKWSGYGISEKAKKKSSNSTKKHNRKGMQSILINLKKSNNSELVKKYLETKKFSQSYCPIGQIWNPEIISQTLRQPRILIQTGKIIDPIRPLTIN